MWAAEREAGEITFNVPRALRAGVRVPAIQAVDAARGPDRSGKIRRGFLYAFCPVLKNGKRALCPAAPAQGEKGRRASRKHGLRQQKHQRQAGGEQKAGKSHSLGRKIGWRAGLLRRNYRVGSHGHGAHHHHHHRHFKRRAQQPQHSDGGQRNARQP